MASSSNTVSKSGSYKFTFTDVAGNIFNMNDTAMLKYRSEINLAPGYLMFGTYFNGKIKFDRTLIPTYYALISYENGSRFYVFDNIDINLYQRGETYTSYFSPINLYGIPLSVYARKSGNKIELVSVIANAKDTKNIDISDMFSGIPRNQQLIIDASLSDIGGPPLPVKFEVNDAPKPYDGIYIKVNNINYHLDQMILDAANIDKNSIDFVEFFENYAATAEGWNRDDIDHEHITIYEIFKSRMIYVKSGDAGAVYDVGPVDVMSEKSVADAVNLPPTENTLIDPISMAMFERSLILEDNKQRGIVPQKSDLYATGGYGFSNFKMFSFNGGTMQLMASGRYPTDSNEHYILLLGETNGDKLNIGKKSD